MNLYQATPQFAFNARPPKWLGARVDISRPQVMGIINLHAQSFAHQGRVQTVEAAIQHAAQLIDEGATILDIGAEPTNPQQQQFSVSAEQELECLLPVIHALQQRFAVLLSVDTSKPEVMRAAVAAGAGLINDVRALRVAGAMATVAELGVPVCLMHMEYPWGMPMGATPFTGDIIQHIIDFFHERIAACEQAGIAKHNILIDPGFGGGSFGKTSQQNLLLIKRLDAFLTMGLPVVVGVSRKTTIGDVLNATVEQRLFGSIALAALVAHSGAAIIRTHDVKATADAIKMVVAIDEG